MTTRKEASPPQGGLAMEAEQFEKELDCQTLLGLCQQHCHGVPVSYGINDRKSTLVCTTDDFDDGSGEALTAGKCPNINQQADHSKCAN